MRSSAGNNLLKKIPRKEEKWVLIVIDNSIKYIITSNRRYGELPTSQTTYYLYMVVDDGFIKISSSKNPQKFDTIIFEGRKNK